MEVEELRQVIAHWDLGDVSSIQELHLGSSRAPKVIIESSDGSFLLKRLAPGRTDPDRIVFQHRLHRALQSSGYPVPELVQLQQGSGTLLELDGHKYELCRYVEGRRFDGSENDAKSSGSRLAGFHDLGVHHMTSAPPGRGYHGRSDVHRAAEDLVKSRPSLDQVQCHSLCSLLKGSAAAIEPYWSQLPATVVHGDWHPGNMLFGAWGVNAVLDLETVRVEPRVAELANALLQFSLPLRADVENDATAEDAPNMELLRAMVSGYALVARNPMTDIEVEVLPLLMIEAISVEAAITLHKKGRFGAWSGPGFLDFVCRRGGWILDNAGGVRDVLSGG